MGSLQERKPSTRRNVAVRNEGRTHSMTITLQDPARERDATSRHAFPEMREVELRAPRTLAEELLASFRSGELDTKTVFELSSHGGYSRSVAGTIAYLDEEAHTFMVRGPDDGLMRVPLRDVTSVRREALSESDALPAELDGAGLGTG
jgi:hypothetical protein